MKYLVNTKFAIYFQNVNSFHRKYLDPGPGTYLRHMKMTPNSWAATNGRRGEEKPTNEEAWWRWLPVVLILVHASQHQHSYTNFLPLLYPEMLVSWLYPFLAAAGSCICMMRLLGDIRDSWVGYRWQAAATSGGWWGLVVIFTPRSFQMTPALSTSTFTQL